MRYNGFHPCVSRPSKQNYRNASGVPLSPSSTSPLPPPLHLNFFLFFTGANSVSGGTVASLSGIFPTAFMLILYIFYNFFLNSVVLMVYFRLSALTVSISRCKTEKIISVPTLTPARVSSDIGKRVQNFNCC
jgi:hypothetical protein